MPKPKDAVKSSDEKPKKSKTTKTAPTIEETYKKKTQREHILHLPDTYIGSVEADKKEMWVFDQDTEKIVKKEITFVSGFYKTFDELAVNARDNTDRDPTCNIIKINLDQKVLKVFFHKLIWDLNFKNHLSFLPLVSLQSLTNYLLCYILKHKSSLIHF